MTGFLLKKVLCALMLFNLALGPLPAARGETPAPPAAGGERKVLGDLDLRSPSGRQVSLIPLVGTKAIVVVFWATWCPLCRQEVARLNDLDRDRLVKVVAVNIGESAKKVEAFTKKYNVTYDVVLDPDGAVAKAFQVPGVPSCVILGRSGLIVFRGSILPEEIDYYLAQ